MYKKSPAKTRSKEKNKGQTTNGRQHELGNHIKERQKATEGGVEQKPRKNRKKKKKKKKNPYQEVNPGRGGREGDNKKINVRSVHQA